MSLALVAGRADADFADGLAAYDAGDYQAAYLAWLPLAKAGDGEAQAAIADLYMSELLIEPAGAAERRRVRNTAVWWYRRAARCGHVVAQLNLGDLYRRGIGVERDLVRAYLWLGLAARANSAWAAAEQQRTARDMTAPQRAEAARRIESWTVAAGCVR